MTPSLPLLPALSSVACGFVAGAFGGVAIAIVEPMSGMSSGPTTLAAAMAASLGFMLPIGLIVGFGLVVIRTLLTKEYRPTNWFLVLVASDSPASAGRVLAVGIACLVFLPVFYNAIFHFLTSYRHKGLAALALALTLTFFLVVSLLAIRRLASAVSHAFLRLSAKWTLLKRPAASAFVVLAIWLLAIIPPLVRGPDAKGIFGFVGFLRKDGLGAGPLVSLLALTLIAAGLLWPLLSRPRRSVPILAVIALLLGCAGPLFCAWIVKSQPDALELLDSGSGAMAVLLKAGRKLSDRDGDGHGHWLGGADCDDSNPGIHPGARDIPENGIDEDCSGRDLELATVQAHDESETPAPGLKVLARPDLPDDISLLMITVDTFRWDASKFMGYKRDVTPNIDRVAARGSVYEQAYGLGSYTGQAVPPMLTGKYASELERNDRHEVRISSKETFAAELICGEKTRCAGFLTHFLFKPHYGWNQGFGKWTVVGADPPGPGHIDSKYNSHIVTNQAMRWLKNPENTKGRFWLWVHYMDPHKEYLEHKGFKQFGSDRRSRYDHELLYTDHHVGKLLDFFATLPAAKNTVIMITSDHGEAFNEHGRWCHGRELWEEIIRVPLIFAGPGIAIKRIDRQTSQIDIFPTLLDLFGVPIPKGLHGRSLLADWVQGQQLPERPIIADQPRNPYYETRRIFIKDGWKLHHLPDTNAYRFFKITDDYEQGASAIETEPKKFAEIKTAYERFLAIEFKPIDPH